MFKRQIRHWCRWAQWVQIWERMSWPKRRQISYRRRFHCHEIESADHLHHAMQMVFCRHRVCRRLLNENMQRHKIARPINWFADQRTHRSKYFVRPSGAYTNSLLFFFFGDGIQSNCFGNFVHFSFFFLAQTIPIQMERILDRKAFKCESAHWIHWAHCVAHYSQWRMIHLKSLSIRQILAHKRQATN